MTNAQPHDEHRWLQQLLGDWTCTSECSAASEPPPSTGTEHVRALGALWVVCEGSASMPDGSSGHMLMTLGYDPAQGAFVGSWAGSMMACMFFYRGTLDAARQTLTLETEGPNCTGGGGTSRYRDVIALAGPDERTLTSLALQPDGSWTQVMQVRYQRVRT